MDDLENEAAVVDAELESGGRVVLAALGVRAPFDVEADCCGGREVEALGFEEPGVDVGGGYGEEGLDGGVGVEGNVVEIVGVVREVMV